MNNPSRSRHYSPVHSLLIILSLTGLVDLANGQDSVQPPDDVALAGQLNVELTESGVTEFLNGLLETSKDLPEKELDNLIAELGGDTYKERESAMHQLASLPDPPVEKLRAAAKHQDFELATRAKSTLALIERRQDPRAAVFRLIRVKEIKTDPAKLLEVIAVTKDEKTFSAALETFAAAIGNGEHEMRLLRDSLKDDRTRVVAAAVRVMSKIQQDKPTLIVELRKWLKHESMPIRMAAARALVYSGQSLDFQTFGKLLDDHSSLIVLRNEEKNFRDKNKDNRQDREVRVQYQSILAAYSEALVKTGNAKQERKRSSGDGHWIKLGLDTSEHPELLMYRIKWLNGNWSGWFVPGFNDRETGKGRDIRYWACFNDHEHETIVATKKSMHREIQDLP